MAEYASKGLSGTALGLGVAGTVGLVSQMSNNGCGNGILGGLFGGNNGNCYVTEKENNLSTALAIAQSEKYTSEKATENLKELYAETLRLNTIQRETDAKISDGLIQTGNALGILNAEVACIKQDVARNREEARFYTDTKVDAEATIRKCEDEKIVVYTNGQLATKVSQVQNKIDIDQLCGASPLSCGCNG